MYVTLNPWDAYVSLNFLPGGACSWNVGNSSPPEPR